MKRRSALATAAAVAGTLVAASAAAALNTTILTSGPDDGVGSVTPVNEIVATDTDQSTTVPAAPEVRGTVEGTVTTLAGSSVAGVNGAYDDDDRDEHGAYGDDDRDEHGAYGDDDRDEHGEHDDDDGEGEREYEGYDHDD